MKIQFLTPATSCSNPDEFIVYIPYFNNEEYHRNVNYPEIASTCDDMGHAYKLRVKPNIPYNWVKSSPYEVSWLDKFTCRMRWKLGLNNPRRFIKRWLHQSFKQDIFFSHCELFKEQSIARLNR